MLLVKPIGAVAQVGQSERGKAGTGRLPRQVGDGSKRKLKKGNQFIGCSFLIYNSELVLRVFSLSRLWFYR
jgi:hypothetical protein